MSTYLSEEQPPCPRHSGAVRSAGGSERVCARTHAVTEAPALGRCVARALGVRSEAEGDSQSLLSRSQVPYYGAHGRRLPDTGLKWHKCAGGQQHSRFEMYCKKRKRLAARSLEAKLSPRRR